MIAEVLGRKEEAEDAQAENAVAGSARPNQREADGDQQAAAKMALSSLGAGTGDRRLDAISMVSCRRLVSSLFPTDRILPSARECA